MIVSHKHKFIFLHSRKTAGSAVTLKLLRYLEPDDLWFNAPAYGIMNDALHSGFVPPPARHPAVMDVVREHHGEQFARKVMETPGELTRDERMAFAQTYNSLQLPHPKPGGWQHIIAARARDHLGPDVWRSYFKFSFERNPWDRMASLYWWRVRADDPENGPPFSFREFITVMHSGDRDRMRAYRATTNSNWRIYTIDDQVAVDHLGRYETLLDDLRHVLEKIGLPFDGTLPQSKHRTRRSGLGELYDAETIRLVGEIFHREVSLLGYTPPSID